MRLLIVDDNDDFRITLIDYLKKQNLGLKIYEASSGEMAVAKASCVKPDIILMDINLPKADGFQTAKIIKEDLPDSEIIILTMFEVEPFRKLGQSIGATDFVGKTEVHQRLIPAIKKCIELKRMTKQVL